jgi:RNA polymerase sigma-70 factor (ECF subfamily)
MRSDRRTAFERFCHDEYAGVVRAAYLVTGDRQEALDLAQEAFARAYERWRAVSGYQEPAAWVRRVAINLAISWRRHERVRASTPVPRRDDVLQQPDLPDPELLEALHALTAAQRAVIVLRFYADRSIEDVARDLHKRPGTVRALTSQALTRLRRTIHNDEVHDDVTI